jgi:ABC-type transport system substrate-binding protein
MLEETGLFEVELVSTEWAQFTQEAWPGEDGQYPVFMLGWNPDYFDPDTYIEPFYSSGGFLGMYINDEMDDLIEQQQRELDADERARSSRRSSGSPPKTCRSSRCSRRCRTSTPSPTSRGWRRRWTRS